MVSLYSLFNPVLCRCFVNNEVQIILLLLLLFIKVVKCMFFVTVDINKLNLILEAVLIFFSL